MDWELKTYLYSLLLHMIVLPAAGLLVAFVLKFFIGG